MTVALTAGDALWVLRLSSGIAKAVFLEWTRRTIAGVAGDGDRAGKVGMDVNIDSNSEQRRKKQSETLPMEQVGQGQTSNTDRWSPSIAPHTTRDSNNEVIPATSL